tara:strand:- start:182521 stop:183321 length:801 start_codon:yes stop_codon:yes gene_type:complete
MNNFIDLVKDFDFITEIAYDLSQQFDGVETEGKRKKLSTYYLAKIVPSCTSLINILPNSDKKKVDFVDFSSISSLCRNLIEGANLHWYYCIDEAEKTEIDFRFTLYEYHDATTMLRIANYLGFSAEDISYLENRRTMLRTDLESSEIFSSLEQEARRQIIKGRKCSLLSQAEIAFERKLDMDEFNGIYKLLSNHVHSTPTSIKDTVHRQIHGSEMEEVFSGLILSYSACFLADMVKSIGEIWELEFAKEASKEIIISYSNGLHRAT